MKIALICLLFCCAGISSSAQTVTYTDTLYPDKDAMIDDANLNSNYGTHGSFIAKTADDGAGEYTQRSLIDFDLSSLPSNATITGATLRLIGQDHQSESGNGNACYLNELEESWNESEVTWNDAPAYTTANQLSLAASDSSDQIYEVDVKEYCQSKFESPSTNYGYLFMLQLERTGERLDFYSSDDEDPGNNPQLIVTYTIPKIDIEYSLTNLSLNCTDDSSSENKGSIDLTVSDGVSPYTYSWSNNETTEDVDSLDAGIYKVVVTDSLGDTDSLTIGVGYKVKWDYFLLMRKRSEDTLEQARSDNNFWNGATAANILVDGEDGWVEYTIPSTSENKVLGFSIWNTRDRVIYSDIEYAFFVNSSSQFKKVLSGTQTYLDDYAAGDILRVEKRNDTIFYFKNGVQHSYTSGIPSGDMYIQASVWHSGGMFEDVRTSVKPGPAFRFDRTAISCLDTIGGKVSLSPYCGDPPFEYSWNDGMDSTDHVKNTAPGVLEVVAVDSLTQTRKNYRTVSTGYDIYWRDEHETVISSDTVRRNAGDGDWLAGAAGNNILLPDQDGWIEYIVPDSSFENKAFGLIERPDPTYDYTDFLVAWRFYDDGVYRRYQDGNLTSNDMGSYEKGDIFKIFRRNDTIFFYRNNHFQGRLNNVNAADPLYPAVSIYDSLASFNEIKASFPPQCFQINTGYALDSINYVLSGADLPANTYMTGGKELFYPVDTLLEDSSVTFHLEIDSTSRSDSLDIYFDLTSDHSIENMKMVVSDSLLDTVYMDSSYFSAHRTRIGFYAYGDSYLHSPESNLPMVYPELESGILMSPDGDSSYETLKINGLDKVDSYQITVKDLSDNTVFTTTDKNTHWNGKYMQTGSLQDPGTYNYEITIDGETLNGQFLMDY